MKQIFIQNGHVNLEEVPTPKPGDNEILVKVCYSCISPGTERKKIIESGSGSQIKSTIENPRRIRKAYTMLLTEGLKTVLKKVKGKLSIGDPIGYSLSGIVIETGKNVNTFSKGDRVACAGAQCAFHAEYVCVPYLLAIRIPNTVSMEQASTVALGAISLHGIHRSECRIGEYIAVIGLGALGLITSLLLKHAGCKVIGFDLNDKKLKLARKLGIPFNLNPSDESVNNKVDHITMGYGVDAVILTAASTDAGPLKLAASICRKKGKVVVVGESSLTLNRKDWYSKEMDLLISTSYGPGRYDPAYELNCQDYPYAYVRWTENRNMAAYLSLIDSGVDLSQLSGKAYPVTEAEKAFKNLENNLDTYPLTLLKYNDSSKKIEHTINIIKPDYLNKDLINVAIVGAGSFAVNTHLPNLKKLKNLYQIYAIVDKQSHTAKDIALRYNARYATTNYEKVLQDKNVDLIFITTRHNLHAALATQAARAGKAIFLEKPMATNQKQLIALTNVLIENRNPFMVGFNRRFSPHISKLKMHLDDRSGPLMIHYRINSNLLPSVHWVNSNEGGGRIIGEACHFIDLLTFLVSSNVCSFTVEGIRNIINQLHIESNFQITLKYEDGSLADLFYTSLGAKELPKEYLEVFYEHQVITLSNFQQLIFFGSKIKAKVTRVDEKGHFEELKEFAKFLKGEVKQPIQLKEIIQTTNLTFKINEMIKNCGGEKNEN